jgi:uncharacterized protein YggE
MSIARGTQALAAAALVIAAAQPSRAQTREPEGPVVVTSGEGIVRAAPDRAVVTLTAETRARNPREAQQQTAAAMAAVQQRLKTAGIAPTAIRTISIDLHPEFDYPNNKQTLRDYVARNVVEVTVDELARLGEVIDASVAEGATGVSGVRFDVRDRDRLEREALKGAVEEARARAEAAAEAAGRVIDRVLRIQDDGAAPMPPPMPMMAMRAEAASPQTPVAPGEIEVRARVTLTASIR